MRPLHNRSPVLLHGWAGLPAGSAGRGEGGDMKRTFTVCPYCGTGCMFHLLSLGRRLVGVEPSRIHPISRGGLCVKGWNAFSFVGHPDRLTVPLVRKNGQLVPASWEDALERVVAGLKAVQEKH